MRYYLPTAVVDLDNLDNNLHQLCRQSNTSPDRVIAVVKDSGYGVGSFEMVCSLEQQGVEWFAVAGHDEALFLRSKGVKSNILLLGLAPTTHLDEIISNTITVSIVNTGQLSEYLESESKPDLHLLVDTGMNRNGLRYDSILNGDYDDKLRELASQIKGIYTHFHSSDQLDQSPTEKQRRRFSAVIDHLKQLDINPKIVHSGNSGATIFGTTPSNEMVRFGISLHGVTPDCSISDIGLKEVTEIVSSVSSLRSICAEDGVGYSHLHKSSKNSQIATVPLGYGSGFLRQFTGVASVIINGKRYPILARVTMDFLLIDIGDDAVNLGDVVTILGKNGAEVISLCELSSAVNTIPYEILCQLGSSLDHHYIRSGKVVSKQNRSIF